jgi:glutamate/tyrosine decarboxylase-like PLP-dependent enzyme
MRQLLENTASRAIRYLDEIKDRKVAPTPTAVAALAALDQSLPDGPADAAQVIRLLDECCSAATMAFAGPRFFGFVIGGSLPAALASNWLAGAWDQATGIHRITPATATLERLALGWLLDLLGLPKDCAGGFVTGATMANFSALAAARHRLLVRAGWDIEGQGLFGAPPLTVVVSAEVHPTVLKGIGLLGLGRNRVVKVPVDDQGRMRLDALPALEGPTIVCTQAGNVNTGAVDPIAKICNQSQAAGAWVHVDGAFGLWAATAPSRTHLVAGLDKADSWATDAHKWLNVPYDCGITFVRDSDALRAAMAVTAEYLPQSEERDPYDYTPELSRRARGVEVWAALQSLGRSGLAEMIERCCRHAQRFADGLASAGHQVLNEVVLNQVLVSFGEPETTNSIIKGIQDEGTCWCGGTVWQGKTAMRISVCNWSTTEEDVDISLEAIKRIAAQFKA